MEKLDNKKLANIKGGFTMNGWTFLGIAAAIVFISGVIEGITNPERCIIEHENN